MCQNCLLSKKAICLIHQQEVISQKEIVFRFRKNIQSEKGWRFDISCMRSPGVKGICADALLCDSLSCLRFIVEAIYSTEPVSFQRGRVTCDESCAIIHTVHLRLIYEAKIQVLSVFSWKPAQPRYVKTKKFVIFRTLK